MGDAELVTSKAEPVAKKEKNPLEKMADAMKTPAKLMEASMKAQEAAQTLKTELAASEFKGYDKDETVQVIYTGTQIPVSCDMTQEAVDLGPEVASKRIFEAIQDAYKQSVDAARFKTYQLAKDMSSQY